MFKDNLVKAVHKDNSLWDWNSSLRWLWKSDNTKNWKVYSTETAGHWWDNRNLVQQQQKEGSR